MNSRRIIPGQSASFGSEPMLKTTTVPAGTGKFIVVSFDHSDGHSMSKRPYNHDTRDAACLEAERLATASPGTTYVVLEVVGSVTATGHVWK